MSDTKTTETTDALRPPTAAGYTAVLHSHLENACEVMFDAMKYLDGVHGDETTAKGRWLATRLDYARQPLNREPDEHRIPTEVMQILRAGMDGDADRVRRYVEHWAGNLRQQGAGKSADRLTRELTGEPGRSVTLD